MSTYRVLEATFRVAPDAMPYEPFQGSLVDDIMCDIEGIAEDGSCDIVGDAQEYDEGAVITFDIDYDGDADDLREALHASFSNHYSDIGLDEGFEILYID